MPRYIGLDLHKMYIHGCEWTPTAPDAQKTRHFRFPNTQEGWTWLVTGQHREIVHQRPGTVLALDHEHFLRPDDLPSGLLGGGRDSPGVAG